MALGKICAQQADFKSAQRGVSVLKIQGIHNREFSLISLRPLGGEAATSREALRA